MEWGVLALVFFVQWVINGITAGIQENTARRNKEEVSAALEKAHEVQEDRLKDEYEAAQEQIREQGVQVTGAQKAALSAMGQAGGEGTAARGIVELTEAQAARDLSLLDTRYENAQADLDAQHELALENLEADYRSQEAAILTQFMQANVNAITNFASGALTIRQPGTVLATAVAAAPKPYNPFAPAPLVPE